VEKLLGEEQKPAEEKAPTVVIDGQQPANTQKAVQEGAIEEALQAGKGEAKSGDEEPPTVVVKGK
jgi:hypothetical protein